MEKNLLDDLLPETNWKEIANPDTAKLVLFSRLRKSNPVPNGESEKVFNSNQTVMFPSYPKKCSTDDKKFTYLKDLFIKKQIQKEMFIEFSEVLQLPESVSVSDIITKQLARAIKWN